MKWPKLFLNKGMPLHLILEWALGNYFYVVKQIIYLYIGQSELVFRWRLPKPQDKFKWIKLGVTNNKPIIRGINVSLFIQLPTGCRVNFPHHYTWATKGKGIPLQQPTQSRSSRDVPESLMNFSKLALPCKIIYVYSNDMKGKTHIISLRGWVTFTRSFNLHF